MKPDNFIRLGWTLTALGILIFVVSAIGEYRGWWGLLGLIGMGLGGLLTVVAAVGTASYSATREQADQLLENTDALRAGQASQDRTLSSMDGKLDRLEGLDELEKLEKLEKLDELDELDRLAAIEDAIQGDDGMVRELDAIQLELDAQTDVLEEQLAVLRRIQTDG